MKFSTDRVFMKFCTGRICMKFCTGRIFMKFCIPIFLENLSRKFKSYSKLTRITGILHEESYTFMTVLSQFSLELQMFKTKFLE